ncbi:dihydrolipoamide acetyltransferase family protein [Actinomadura sp. HBU206391]|uniref:dihydrolipoamide acetyltransferase family protein n=1 Tax=Actinomadura sp. HBU206391 TaxID=2731692 RepID=UPI00164F5B1F|nr:dihydrolipoamide acetyltransferase family protein [Actinomadura sp. HBU206391]MBC6457420.1 2-oxo acid dehydrogenase subunit E2 [Actinomadura sp. HBU206391]
MAELKQFKLPDVGEGLTEADIVKWHVQPGDRVEVNQTIVEIETAKAIVELPCPYEGIVAALHVNEGQTVDVGVPIISVDVSGDAAGTAEPEAEPAVRTDALKEDLVPSPPAEGAVEPGMHGSLAPKADPSAASAPKRQPVLVGYGVKAGATSRRPRKRPTPPSAPSSTPSAVAATAVPAPATPVTSVAPAAPARPAASAAPERVSVLAKPPVRKLARDLGVDMTTITGSGPQGSITREDVHAASSSAERTALQGVPSVPTVTPAPGERREERIPVRGVLKNMAAAMTRSAFEAPHVTEFLQVDVTETMAAVKRLRDLPEFEDVKVSPLLLVARALVLAARRHPRINASWGDQEVVVKHYVNLGIAAATERGLIVPNVKNAQDLTLAGLAAALTRLTEVARSGRTPLADMSDGTITITNVGVFGVDTGTPILTPGEVAILAFGQVRDMPWVHEGEIKIRKVTTLALSFDHRVVDGELGSMVLRDVGSLLEDPLRMLAWT